MRVVISAGFDRSFPAIALCELLHRAGHTIAGVIVVSPWSIKRFRSLLRQRGLKGVIDAASRFRGGDSHIRELFADQKIVETSLRHWSKNHAVPYHVVRDLNSPKSIEIASAADGLIYAGGGILRRSMLTALKGRVLNAHAGMLPHIRGMNACEWSLLLGVPLAVTIHFIDEGIDTGPIVQTIAVAIEPGDTIERLRAKCTAAGVLGLVRNVEALHSTGTPQTSHGRQCYVMAPALRELAERRISHE